MFLSVPSKFSYFRVAPAAAGSHCSIAVNIQSGAAFLSHTPTTPSQERFSVRSLHLAKEDKQRFWLSGASQGRALVGLTAEMLRCQN